MRKFCVFFSLLLTAGLARANVQLPPVLSSHMVLQQGMPVPIWGTAAPGEQVTVKFRDQAKTGTADAQGRWLVKLDPLKAGGPDTLTVAGANTLTLEDVLVGEVWLGSGQSNMAMGTGAFAKNDATLAKLAAETNPRLRLIRSRQKSWEVATPQSIPGFSALLFSFGVPLQQALDVPVGLLVGAAGGTPSGRWVREEDFKADAACQAAVAKYAAGGYKTALEKYQQTLKEWEQSCAAARKEGQAEPRKPRPPPLPGECAGNMGSLYAEHVKPFVPFAIRGVLWDQGESGTAVQGVDQYTVMGALIKGWRKAWGQGEFPFLHVQKPSGGGCAWDPQDPVTCRAEAFAPLPADLPLHRSLHFENHLRLNQYPNTCMVMAGDLGSGVHPVCKSGYGVRACRVALGAVYGKPVEYYGPVYASHQIADGKVRITFTHAGSGLAFKHGDHLQGFAVAGTNKNFHWADATMEDNTVVLACAKVPAPVAVRYAWSERRPWANLFNKDGLPAIPFRTDNW